MTEVINHVASFILLSSVIPLGIFVYRYVAHSPFERTAEGINVLFTKLAMLIIIFVALGSVFLGDYPGREYVRLFAFTAPVVLFWIDVVQLWRIQRRYPFSRKRKR